MAASERGMETLQALMGEDGAAAGYRRMSEFSPDFADIVVNTCFGDVWSRPGLPLKLRSIVTIACLTTLGNTDELKGHIKIGLRNGLTPDEIKEIIIHLTQYAGIPAANAARHAFMEATK